MEGTNPIDVEKTLTGIDFPANKEAILNKARENGAGDNEIKALEGLPEQEYADAAEVAQALAGENEEEEE